MSRLELIAASVERLKARAARPRPQRRQQPVGPVGVPTPRQLQTLAFVRDYTAERGRAPEMAEISAAVGCRSAHGSQSMLIRLADKGLITWVIKSPRSLAITPAGHEALAAGRTETARAHMANGRRAELALWKQSNPNWVPQAERWGK